MLIPIFKPGDVLADKTSAYNRKVLVLDSKIKSETEEYTTDMDVGCNVKRHEIKTSEWVEYGVISDNYNFVRIAEDALCRWYRRVSHADLPSCFGEKEAETKIEKLSAENERLRHELVVIKNENEMLKRENEELRVANEKLAKELDKEKKERKAQAMKLIVLKIDAVSAMKTAGFSVEMTARVLDIPEAAVKVYLEAAGEFASEE